MRRMTYAAMMVVAIAALTGPAGAQAVTQQGAPNSDAAAEVRKQFMADLDTLQSKIVALANAFPADKYAWRPAPGVRSVGEVFQHVASEYYVWTPLAYGAPRSSVIQQGRENMQKWETQSTKEQVLKNLAEGFAYTKQQLGSLDVAQLTGTRKLFGSDHTIIETSFIMTADLHEHLGQLIAYARVNGVTPPWSK